MNLLVSYLNTVVADIERFEETCTEYLILDRMMARSEQETKDSIAGFVEDNPMFAAPKDNNRFWEMIQKLNQLRKD